MILGKMGKLPGELAPEIVSIAKSKGYEFYTGNPQDAFPDELGRYRRIMEEEGWDCGQDDEELFELAMHERQYRDYRSGAAKERFLKELETASSKRYVHSDAVPVHAPVKGQMFWEVDLGDGSIEPAPGTQVKAGVPMGHIQTYYGMEEIIPNADGRILSVRAKQGTYVEKGEIVAFISKS